ncbi:unnamed protein product [Boreogadus saida]
MTKRTAGSRNGGNSILKGRSRSLSQQRTTDVVAACTIGRHQMYRPQGGQRSGSQRSGAHWFLGQGVPLLLLSWQTLLCSLSFRSTLYVSSLDEDRGQQARFYGGA